jgi:hypothetical protein
MSTGVNIPTPVAETILISNLFAINYKNQNGQVFDFSFQKYK